MNFYSFLVDTKAMSNQITFNDLPEVMGRILDGIAELRRSVSELKQGGQPEKENRHRPMTAEEAADYLRIPLPTLYDKLAGGIIPATKPGKRYVLYQDELDKWLECNRKNPVPLTAEEQNEAILGSHRRKPCKTDWR